MGPGFAWSPSYTLTPGQPSPGITYPPASPHCFPPRSGSVRHTPKGGQPLSNNDLEWALLWWYRNINRLCIDYAFRPRLSSRLTLGGLGFRRRGFSPLSRYSCQHSHSSALHAGSHRRFTARSTLRYHSSQGRIRGFGSRLEPRYIVRAGSLDQ
jgi:hypothetical protein